MRGRRHRDNLSRKLHAIDPIKSTTRLLLRLQNLGNRAGDSQCIRQLHPPSDARCDCASFWKATAKKEARNFRLAPFCAHLLYPPVRFPRREVTQVVVRRNALEPQVHLVNGGLQAQKSATAASRAS